MNKLKPILITVALLAAVAARGQAGFTNTVNATVPDANPTGITSSGNLSGVSGTISSVTVSLDITGGFNGDLYAYLVDPNGDLAVLLNRVGVTAVGGNNYFGYGDTGFNVTLSDSSGNNIHNYQSGGVGTYTLNGGGQLTGTWAPDGRNILPNSTPSAFDSGYPTADLSAFNSTVPNGQWTLFIADLSGGGTSTLVSWGLTVVTVPEPQTWAMAVGGLGMLLALRRSRSK